MPSPALPSKDRDRTMTGLQMVFIGFLLAWIPYVQIVGDLFVFVGVIFLFLGRHAFGEQHRRSVVLGASLIVLGLLGALFVGVIYAEGVVSAASMPGATVAQIGAQISGLFTFLIVASAVLGALVFLGEVFLAYRLATPQTRTVLWAGFVAGIVVFVSVSLVVIPEVASAITAATASGTVNLAPITALQTQETLLGLTSILPYLLLAWAYYRTREGIKPAPVPPRLYGRTFG